MGATEKVKSLINMLKAPSSTLTLGMKIFHLFTFLPVFTFITWASTDYVPFYQTDYYLKHGILDIHNIQKFIDTVKSRSPHIRIVTFTNPSRPIHSCTIIHRAFNLDSLILIFPKRPVNSTLTIFEDVYDDLVKLICGIDPFKEINRRIYQIIIISRPLDDMLHLMRRLEAQSMRLSSSNSFDDFLIRTTLSNEEALGTWRIVDCEFIVKHLSSEHYHLSPLRMLSMVKQYVPEILEAEFAVALSKPVSLIEIIPANNFMFLPKDVFMFIAKKIFEKDIFTFLILKQVSRTWYHILDISEMASAFSAASIHTYISITSGYNSTKYIRDALGRIGMFSRVPHSVISDFLANHASYPSIPIRNLLECHNPIMSFLSGTIQTFHIQSKLPISMDIISVMDDCHLIKLWSHTQMMYLVSDRDDKKPLHLCILQDLDLKEHLKLDLLNVVQERVDTGFIQIEDDAIRNQLLAATNSFPSEYIRYLESKWQKSVLTSKK